MKTVLIVEDEKMIRQGIRVMIQRSGVPVENIVECSNGVMALEMLQKQAVDVMFTDIRMPKMDGIQLVTEVQKLPNKPKIVAVSGYDDFSYAVDMMRNGVQEYLLKPLEREKLISVLKKLEAEITEHNRLVQAEQIIGKGQLRHILLDEIKLPEEMDGIVQKYGASFFTDGYRVCVTAPEFTVAGDDRCTQLGDIHDGNVYICSPAYWSEVLENEICQENAGVSDIVNDTVNGIRELRDAYESAFSMRKRAFFCEQNMIAPDVKEKKVQEGLRKEALKQLTDTMWMQRVHLIGTEKTDELTGVWKGLFTEARHEHIYADEFEIGICGFLEELKRVYKSLIDDDMQERIERCCHIYSFSGITDYEDFVMDILLELHDMAHAKSDDHGVKAKLQQAVEYMEKNYSSDLNMAVVSNYISMNYSVFSYEFKNYTGVNFVTYLRELRMNEAKKLLAETDKKVLEISQLVGYENEKHFMKQFKLVCGVSPSEYRKNMKI